MSVDLEQAADILADVRLGCTPLDMLPTSCRPKTVEQGYSIESHLRKRLEKLGLGVHQGYKIGCTTAVMQKFLQIDQPCYAGILANTIYDRSVNLKFNDYQRVGVECEVAVRLAKDVVVAADRETTTDEVAEAVGGCMVAMEIVDNRYADFTTVGTPTLIADGFFGAGCVLGEDTLHWRELDMENVSGRMCVDGKVVGSGIGSAILGHPLNALSWLANNLSQSGQALKAGELVLLGSIVQTHWVNCGESIVVEIDGLGRAEATFS